MLHEVRVIALKQRASTLKVDFAPLTLCGPQLAAHHPQLGQRRQRLELTVVLQSSAMRHPSTLDDPKRVRKSMLGLLNTERGQRLVVGLTQNAALNPESREMAPSTHECLEALGRSNVDPKVVSLLDRLGLAHQKIELRRGDFDTALDAPEHGIDLVFSDPQSYVLTHNSPEGSLILSCVFFFSEGRENHRQYPLDLPAGLTFSASREEVRKLFGTPEFSSPILPVDRWTWNGLKLAVTFVESQSSIARVSCSLPKGW